MADDNYRKRQIRKCLDCKIGVKVIRDYNAFYRMVMKEDKIRNYLKDIDNDALRELPKLLSLPKTGESVQKQLKHVSEDDIFKAVLGGDGTDIIEELSEILLITGTVREKYNVLRQLSQKDDFDEEESHVCLVNLQRIIYALHDFYEENENKLMGRNIYKEYVLRAMNELNKERIPGYDGECGRKALKLFGTKDDYEYEEKIVKGFNNIFEEFCFHEKETYDIAARWQCIKKELDEVMRVHDEVTAPRLEFFERLDRLDSKSREILLEYIRYAPKKLNINFQIVMAKQHMSESDILKFINETLPRGAKRKNISAVQNLAKASASNEIETIRLACKALLISEDVLYRGTGKIYGDLGALLSDEVIRDIRELAQKEGMKNVTRNKTDNQMEKFVKNEIRGIIQRSGMDLRKLTEMHPDLFQEEDYCLYDDEGCFDFLQHKEEALALLEVLERMEREKG